MEVDQFHAAIEKTKKFATAKIDSPRDWANLVLMVPRKPPFAIYEIR